MATRTVTFVATEHRKLFIKILNKSFLCVFYVHWESAESELVSQCRQKRETWQTWKQFLPFVPNEPLFWKYWVNSCNTASQFFRWMLCRTGTPGTNYNSNQWNRFNAKCMPLPKSIQKHNGKCKLLLKVRKKKRTLVNQINDYFLTKLQNKPAQKSGL